MTRDDILKRFPNASEDTIRETLAYHSMNRNPLTFGGAAPPPEARPPEPDAPFTGTGLRASKRIRQDSKPLMNKLETEWFNILKATHPAESIVAQGIRFRLGNGIFYKPDFIVFGLPLKAFEVKGPHAFRGGFENLKVAATTYKQIEWILVWRESGQWKEQKVLA